MNDAIFDELDEQRQREETEMELYHSIIDAIQKAKDIGLDDESVKVLCYVAWVEFDNLD